MKLLEKLFFALLFFYVGFILYTHRALLASKFDQVYWKDKYEHSQWKLPLSQRTLGDDGLYLYEGYRLIHGEDPTTMNAEVPPLGKYLIGLSILTLGNGHWFGFLSTLLGLLAVFLLARGLTKSSAWALAATLLFAMDPLLTSQFPLTMLDSLQMALGILTLWMLTKILTNPQSLISNLSLTLLGLCFGLFAATKAPIFSPIMGLVVAVTLLVLYRSVKPLIITFATSFAVYVATYIPYFLLGHSFIDWLKVQKWILMFYRGSYIAPNIGSPITTLTINRYQNLFTKTWETPSHFSFVWPVLMCVLVLFVFLLLFRKTKQPITPWLPTIGFLLLSLGSLSIIPFWTRYLLAILPLLYISCIGLLSNFNLRAKGWIIIVALLVLNSVSSIPVLFPTPEGTVKQTLYAWRHGFFQDVYEELTSKSRSKKDRKTFHTFGLTTYYDGEIEDADIMMEPMVWNRFTTTQQVPIRVTYKTRNLGTFTEKHILPVVKEYGRWKIAWEWNLAIDGLTPERTLSTTVVPAKRGAIIPNDGNNKPIAQDIRTVRISVIPNDIDKTKEEKMFKMLETLFEGRASAVSMHQRSVGNALGDRPVPLGVLPFAIDPNLQKDLLSYPGLLLTGAFSRQWSPRGGVDVGKIANTLYDECCSYLYNTTAYDGISGLEKQFNEKLKGINGGSLVIKDAQGKVVRTILSVEKKDGENVEL